MRLRLGEVRVRVKCLQAGHAVANRAGDIDLVAGPGPRSSEDAPGCDGADGGQVHDERPGRPGDVAADERDLVSCCQRQQAVQQGVDVGRRQLAGKHQRQQRGAGDRAHGRQVAQVDRERLVPDGVGRTEAPVEMNVFDERVGGEHVGHPPLGLDHRGVIARSHEDPCRRCQASLDALDERALADVGDCRHLAIW
jgi:hypothetical protein